MELVRCKVVLITFFPLQPDTETTKSRGNHPWQQVLHRLWRKGSQPVHPGCEAGGQNHDGLQGALPETSLLPCSVALCWGCVTTCVLLWIPVRMPAWFLFFFACRRHFWQMFTLFSAHHQPSTAMFHQLVNGSLNPYSFVHTSVISPHQLSVPHFVLINTMPHAYAHLLLRAFKQAYSHIMQPRVSNQ